MTLESCYVQDYSPAGSQTCSSPGPSRDLSVVLTDTSSDIRSCTDVGSSTTAQEVDDPAFISYPITTRRPTHLLPPRCIHVPEPGRTTHQIECTCWVLQPEGSP